MAGTTKVQTKPGKGRSRESWYGGGSQAASMSQGHANTLELAGAKQPVGGGYSPTRNTSNPGEPGVSAARFSKALGSGVRAAPTPKSPSNKAAGQPASSSRRRRGAATTSPGVRQQVHPAQPGVTTRLAGKSGTGSRMNLRTRGRDAAKTVAPPGTNPGESSKGRSGVSRARANQGPENDLIKSLVPLAQKLGAQMTTRHLQNAAAAASGRDYRSGVTHLSRAHETARRDGNVQLMNAIQKASGMIRQAVNS